jgi:hypothetical protein
LSPEEIALLSLLGVAVQVRTASMLATDHGGVLPMSCRMQPFLDAMKRTSAALDVQLFDTHTMIQ